MFIASAPERKYIYSRSRSPLSRLPLVNLSDVQAGLEELGGPSATPIRGPNRFMPVLSGLGVFKVPFPFFPPPEPVIPATQSERTKNSVALEHEFEHTKFLVNWVPRLQGRKLIVEGNLLDLRLDMLLYLSNSTTCTKLPTFSPQRSTFL